MIAQNDFAQLLDIWRSLTPCETSFIITEEEAHLLIGTDDGCTHEPFLVKAEQSLTLSSKTISPGSLILLVPLQQGFLASVWAERKKPKPLSPFESIYKKALKAAPADVPVLITGESGTGKGVLAHYIYDHSSRADKPLVEINMAAMPPQLMESELFGHVKGAFTDAHAPREGFIQRAHGGTLFLDEIGDLPLPLQSRLLKVLQDGSYSPVGSVNVKYSDLRILAATNRDLPRMVEHQQFRSDLYYRLNIIHLHVPPLREHNEDLTSLVNSILLKIKGPDHPRVSPRALSIMKSYPWPGNIRELENVLQRAVIFAQRGVLEPDDLNLPQGESAEKKYQGKSMKEAINLFKKEFISHNLHINHGNKSRTAEAIDIQRTYLCRLIKELDIQ